MKRDRGLLMIDNDFSSLNRDIGSNSAVNSSSKQPSDRFKEHKKRGGGRNDGSSSLQMAANQIIANPSSSGIGPASQLPPRSEAKKNYRNKGQTVNVDTNQYMVDMKKGNSNILVSVRCRPLSIKELQKQTVKSVKVLDEKLVILKDESEQIPEAAFRQGNRSKEQSYAFDIAFDEDVGQTEVFEKSTKFLIDGIMGGYNGTVFAYGATGAGKTHTMLGTAHETGIMGQSIQELFNQIEGYSNERDYKLKISYVEVYNEVIKDLLSGRNTSLDLREDVVKGVCVAGVLEIMTTNTEEIMRYIVKGNEKRTKERTDANEASSRSHAVLQVTVEHKDRAHGTSAEINIAKMSLIDLAGSERASNTNNRGVRLLEGANINKSLLALGNCINALCENQKGKGQTHVPFRDSKLTRLLKDSLGGNCRTVMIANISPAWSAFEDTRNTLKYADRAKQIKTIVKRNVLNVNFHIENYTKIINQLRSEITSLRVQLQKAGGDETLVNRSTSIHSGSNTRPEKAGNFAQKEHELQLQNLQIELSEQFEKEVLLKKEIYEIDKRNEDIAFQLFSKQMQLTSLKNKNKSSSQIEQEVLGLKKQIEMNHRTKASQQQLLNKQIQARKNSSQNLSAANSPLTPTQTKKDVLSKQHELNLKQIDMQRKENRAEFHIKQRDNIIEHLKEQLVLRDRIIKDKFGQSISNFLPASKDSMTEDNTATPIGGRKHLQKPTISQDALGATFYQTSTIEQGDEAELLTYQDIDSITKQMINPSLQMTVSSSFSPDSLLPQKVNQRAPKTKFNPYQNVASELEKEIQPKLQNQRLKPPGSSSRRESSFNRERKEPMTDQPQSRKRASVGPYARNLSSGRQGLHSSKPRAVINRISPIKNRIPPRVPKARQAVGNSHSITSGEQSLPKLGHVNSQNALYSPSEFPSTEPNNQSALQLGKPKPNLALMAQNNANSKIGTGVHQKKESGYTTESPLPPKSFAAEMSKNKKYVKMDHPRRQSYHHNRLQQMKHEGEDYEYRPKDKQRLQNLSKETPELGQNVGYGLGAGSVPYQGSSGPSYAMQFAENKYSGLASNSPSRGFNSGRKYSGSGVSSVERKLLVLGSQQNQPPGTSSNSSLASKVKQYQQQTAQMNNIVAPASNGLMPSTFQIQSKERRSSNSGYINIAD